jgi:hypothetical protein
VTVDLVFDGWIAGLGTREGTRAVLGRWSSSPWGAFADVMVERADGHRILLAPSNDVADFVSTTYRFDEVIVVPVGVRTDAVHRSWHVTAGPLLLSFRLGGRTAQGRLLAALPRPVTRSPLFAAAVDPVARALVPGVRTRGTAGGGRIEWYCASAQYAVVGADARWAGTDLGPLTDVVPPVRFGFSSSPRTPAVTRVRTVVRG